MAIEPDEIALILAGVDILQDLDVDIIDDIAVLSRITKFEQGDLVIKAGTIGELKRRSFYEKPTIKKKKKSAMARKRLAKQRRKMGNPG